MELYHQTVVHEVNVMKKRAYYTLEEKNVDVLTDCKFSYFEKFTPELFNAEGKNEEKVPFCWQVRGYDAHQYTNVRYPFPYDPPYILKDIPCGVYDFDYELKSDKEKHYITFQGVDSCFYLFVNGNFVGYATISHALHEFDITNYLQKQNKIKVVVLKWCSGSYLEDQDKLRMSGIFGEVKILHRPQDHVFDYSLKSDIVDGKGVVRFVADKACKVTVKDGEKVVGVSEGEKVEFQIENPKLWNAEEPNLYDVIIERKGETFFEKVGVRKVTIEKGVFLLNGKPVKFKGVNRHSSTKKGYVETIEDLKTDLAILKENNFNAIRTSHYPPHPELPRLCDEQGFYLMLEADVETHGVVSRFGGYDCEYFNDIAEDPQFQEAIVARSASAYERDKNRTSVLIWSLGNESGWGENFEQAARFIQSVDDRPVHYENVWCAKDADRSKELAKFDFSKTSLDMESRMYAPWQYIDEYDGEIPYVLCEYTHAMGNSCGDAHDYWAAIYRNPKACGAFVWEFCNHTVETPDGKILYGGDFGEKYHDGAFCMDGLVTMDRKCNPSMYELKEVYAPVTCAFDNGVLTITNRYDFISLDEIEGSYEWTEDGEKIGGGALDLSGVSAGETKGFALDVPCVKGYLTLDLFFKKNGKVVGRKQIVVNSEYQGENANELKDISFKETDGKISVEDFIVDVQPIWTRASIDNDRDVDWKWKQVGLYDAQFFVTSKTTEENAVVIKGAIVCDTVQKIADVCIKVTGEGDRIRFAVQTKITTKVEFLPRFGITLTLNPAFKKGVYFACGNGEAYIDRNLAAPLGLYEIEAGENYAYTHPQESGSHYGAKFICLTDGNNRYMVDAKKDFSFCLTQYAVSDYKPHIYEMDKDTGRLYLHIDYKMSGVGSNSCGPKLEKRYALTETEFEYEFTVKAVKGDLFKAHRQN